MNHRWTKSIWLSITAALVLMLACPAHLSAQAIPTASASPLDFSFFAGYGRTSPDYDAGTNPTVTFGFDYTRHFRFPIVPSLEARVNLANGTNVNERTYLVGIRAEPQLRGRFHPYGNFLIGIGDIHYVTNNPGPGYGVGDNSVVKSIGGGINVDVYHHFQVKADAQFQFWNFGGTYTLSPAVYMVGVNYRLLSRNSNPR